MQVLVSLWMLQRALDWLQVNNPNSRLTWVSGFSFGAWMALQLLMRRPEVNSFVCVAPPANVNDFNFLSSCPVKGLIVQGDKDQVVPEEDVYNLYEKLERQRHSEVEYSLISGADHFFREQLDELKNVITKYVMPRLNTNPAVKRSKWDRK